MKIVLKNQIPEFKALPKKQKKEIEQAVEKSIPKIYSFLIVIIPPVICGLSQRFFSKSIGSDAALGVGVTASLVLIFFYITMVKNPRIEQLIKTNQTSQES